MMQSVLDLVRNHDTVFLRAALAAGFLSAVADRFGVWGPPGAAGVAWGDFASFTDYTGRVNPLAPAAIVPLLSWSATVAEIVIAFGLALGLFTRWFALAGGVLLLLFALGMTMGTGIKSALDASVYAASAASFALAAKNRYPWSLDALRMS